MIRVLIVDDQPLFREGLRAVLSADPELCVVGEASDGQAALHLADQHRPDVVLMDLAMPGMDGVVATRRLRIGHPACQILVLTTFDDDEWLFEALRAGAIGYLLKDVAGDRLREAVHVAARGGAPLAPTVAAKVLAELNRAAPSATAPNPLTERERQVLQQLARGASNKEIASALFLAEGTVKNHVTAILTKLGVDGRTQAAIRGRELGWLRDGW